MRLNTIIGKGVISPLRRMGRDFVTAEGSDLVAAEIKQIIKTKRGELRWRPSFGTRLEHSRHKRIDESLLAIVESDLKEALTFAPRAEILEVSVAQDTSERTKLLVRVQWRTVIRSARRNVVVTDPRSSEVTI